MIPEQVWDAPAVTVRGLYPGRARGSAQPPVWAHAEHLKLLRSLEDGVIFDQPPQTRERCLVRRQPARHVPWRMDAQIPTMPVGRTLRIEADEAFRLVRQSIEGR